MTGPAFLATTTALMLAIMAVWPAGAAAESGPVLGATKLRVGDMDKSVAFFETIFDMKQVDHHETPFPDEGSQLNEIMLKNGKTVAAAKASPEPELVLMFVPGKRPAYKASDDLPNIVLVVPSMNEVMKRAADAKAPIFRKPYKFSDHVTIGMIKDPSGNVIEIAEVK